MAASVPNMAYHGARSAGLSTAPLSMAIPHGPGRAMVLDMATSTVSLGRLNRARQRHETLPADWALDSDGEATTDPEQATLLQALGGAKGSGLALMIEMLCSVASGSPILSDLLAQPPAQRRHRQNAWLCAMDAGALLSTDQLTQDVEATVAALKSLPRRAGVSELLMPGERGDLCQAQAQKIGLGLPEETWVDVQRSAEKFGISLPKST
jgi:LDH2 family malate/lactate/ureidoglycolate dehydrogenase